MIESQDTMLMIIMMLFNKVLKSVATKSKFDYVKEFTANLHVHKLRVHQKCNTF
jgi:hypothetical protein